MSLGPLEFVTSYSATSRQVLRQLDIAGVVDLIEILATARQQERQIFACGNGGSAAMASHLVAELGKEASWGRKRRFRVMALNENIPWLTSIANDSDYESIFREQLQNFARSGDLLIGFSCSGNSVNVLDAVTWANENGLTTIGITGADGGKLAARAKRVVRVQSNEVGHIQEGHFLIQHLIAYFFIQAPES